MDAKWHANLWHKGKSHKEHSECRQWILRDGRVGHGLNSQGQVLAWIHVMHIGILDSNYSKADRYHAEVNDGSDNWPTKVTKNFELAKAWAYTVARMK